MRTRGSELWQAILDEAVETVREKGVGGLTMRALARRLGYSPATLYLYFADKSSLLGEVARVGFQELQARVEVAAAESDPLAALRELARVYLDFAREDPEVHQLMFPVDACPLDERRHFFESARSVMQRGIAAGKLRGADAHHMALVFGCLLRGIQQLESNALALGLAGSRNPAAEALDQGLSLLQA